MANLGTDLSNLWNDITGSSNQNTNFGTQQVPNPPPASFPTTILATNTQKITISPGQSQIVLNSGGNNQVDAAVYISNASQLPNESGTSNTVGIVLTDWNTPKQSNITLNNLSFIFTAQNRLLSQMIVQNNYEVPITIFFYYTIKLYNPNLISQTGYVQQVVGIVSAEQFGTWVSNIITNTTASIFELNSNVGEAPQLSSTYGQYDNGSSIFYKYANFNDGAVPSGFNTMASNATITVNNGLTISSTSLANSWAQVYIDTALDMQNYYAESQANSISITGTSGNGIGVALNYDIPANTNSYQSITTGYLFAYSQNPQGPILYSVSNGTESKVYSSTASSSFPIITTGAWYQSLTNEELIAYNYTQYVASDTSLTYGNVYPGLWYGLTGNSSNSATYYWFRIRVVPPVNTMPSVVFNPVPANTTSPYGGAFQYTGTITNNSTSATQTDFTQMIQVQLTNFNIASQQQVYFTTDSSGLDTIPSWFESSINGFGTWWLNLGSNIIQSSGGQLTIYMWVLYSIPSFNLAQVGNQSISLGQKTMSNSFPVVVASDQATFSSGSSYQISVSTTPIQLNNASCQYVLIKNQSNSGGNVYIGFGSNVSSTNGIELVPGQPYGMPFKNSNLIWVISGTGSNTVDVTTYN
jgi:hypothetical protein